MPIKKILITGVAGFIGYHLAQKLLLKGFEVVGIDNLNEYYDKNLKLSRLKELGLNEDESQSEHFTFYKGDLQDSQFITTIFQKENFDAVCNLAAQAGVNKFVEWYKGYYKIH